MKCVCVCMHYRNYEIGHRTQCVTNNILFYFFITICIYIIQYSIYTYLCVCVCVSYRKIRFCFTHKQIKDNKLYNIYY